MIEMAAGEEVAKQAWPIYTMHRRDISKALRKSGTNEAIERNLIIQINGVAAGRPGEVATLSLDVLWDHQEIYLHLYIAYRHVNSNIHHYCKINCIIMYKHASV